MDDTCSVPLHELFLKLVEPFFSSSHHIICLLIDFFVDVCKRDSWVKMGGMNDVPHFMDDENFDLLSDFADPFSDYAEYHEHMSSDGLSPYDYFEDDDLAEYFEPQPDDAVSQLLFVWTHCTVPILAQSLTTAAPLTLLSFALPLLSSIGGAAGLPSVFIHLTSAGLGLAAMLVVFSDSWPTLLAMTVAGVLLYFLLPFVFPHSRASNTLVLAMALLSAAVTCEFAMDAPTWHTLRGPALLVAMKVLSVTIDDEKPSLEELAGYLLCPGTLWSLTI